MYDSWALPSPAMDTISCFLVAYCKRIKQHLTPRRGKIHSVLPGLMSEGLSASVLFVLGWSAGVVWKLVNQVPSLWP